MNSTIRANLIFQRWCRIISFFYPKGIKTKRDDRFFHTLVQDVIVQKERFWINIVGIPTLA